MLHCHVAQILRVCEICLFLKQNNISDKQTLMHFKIGLSLIDWNRKGVKADGTVLSFYASTLNNQTSVEDEDAKRRAVGGDDVANECGSMVMQLDH
jgi:hypothetical protein